MKLRVEVLTALLLLAAGSNPANAGQAASDPYPAGSEGRPRGSSVAEGADRLDMVAEVAVDPALSGYRVTAPGLVPGETAELTSIGSGRIILVLAGQGEGAPRLSPDAAAALGLPAGGAVRVRRVTATAMDAAALRAGRAASARLDAPEALLAGLRLQLPKPAPAAAQPAPPVSAPGEVRPAAAAPEPSVARGEYVVRVAALSNRANADRVARELGGSVTVAGKLNLVRIGPLPDREAAMQARAKAVSAGFRDAVIAQEK